MNRKMLLLTFSFALILTGLVGVSIGQVLGQPYRLNDKQVEQIIHRVEKQAGTFRKSLKDALNKDPKQLYANSDAGRAELLASLNAGVKDMYGRLPQAFAGILVPTAVALDAVDADNVGQRRGVGGVAAIAPAVVDRLDASDRPGAKEIDHGVPVVRRRVAQVQ